MCQFKSGLIFKNRVVLAPEGNESHSDLLESLGIEDSRNNAMKKFIRAELIPKNNNKATNINEWTFKVDQDIVPDWYENDPKRYENDFREAVREYIKESKMVIMCGVAWTPIKTDSNRTYYLLDGVIDNIKFGNNNNYADSSIRKELNNGELAKKLKEEFGDKLVPITTDLLSLDGLDDYGKTNGDVLSLLTVDLYRECRKNISKIDSWYWLATPYSTPSGCGRSSVCSVGSGGALGFIICDDCMGVRPFCILES